MDIEKLKKLALKRADIILESWWHECTGEWQDDEELTDEELEYALGIGFKIELAE